MRSQLGGRTSPVTIKRRNCPWVILAVAALAGQNQARDQWFDFGRNQLSWSSDAVVNSGSVQFAQKVFWYSGGSEDQHVPMWLAFVIDGERLLVVDLRAAHGAAILSIPRTHGGGHVVRSASRSGRKDGGSRRDTESAGRFAADNGCGGSRNRC